MFADYGYANAPRSAWGDVDFISVVSVSDDQVVVLNSDGSETRLFSSSSDFEVVGGQVQGTVTSISRTDSGGITTFEMVDRINVDASDLLAAGSSRFDILVEHASELLGSSSASSSFGVGDYNFGFADFARSLVGSFVDLWQSWGGSAAPAMFSVGTANDNILTGSADSGINVLIGGAGNDTLVATASTDLLVGGAGTDTASYAASRDAVTVDLTDPTANEGDASGDLLVAIENLIGGSGDDTLVADAGDNVLTGGAGNDTLTTGAGNDTIEFGLGSGLDLVTDFEAASLAASAEASMHDSIALSANTGIASFADLINGNHLQLAGGQVEVVLSASDRIVLGGVTDLAALTADNFKF